MRQTLVAYTSQAMIDVSQDARTEIASSPEAPVIPRTRTAYEERVEERVEDSLEDHLETKMGAVQTPQQAEDEVDEMYDLSPKGRVSLEAARFAGPKTKATESRYQSGDPLPDQPQAPEDTDRRSAEGPPRMPATESSLFNGVSKRFLQRDGQLSKATKPTKAARVSEKGCDENGQNSKSEHDKQMQPDTVAHQPLERSRPPTSNGQATDKRPRASVGTSSLAALRAKRQGLPFGQSEHKPPSVTDVVFKHTSTASSRTDRQKTPFQEGSKNVQTPARGKAKASATVVAHTGHLTATGKLKSRRMGMFAETPLAPSGLSEQAKCGRPESEAMTAVATKATSTKNKPGQQPAAASATAAPSTVRRTNGKPDIARDPQYDIPESPPKPPPANRLDAFRTSKSQKKAVALEPAVKMSAAPGKRNRDGSMLSLGPAATETAPSKKQKRADQEPSESDASEWTEEYRKLDPTQRQQTRLDEHRRQPARLAKRRPVEGNAQAPNADVSADEDEHQGGRSSLHKPASPKETLEEFEDAVVYLSGPGKDFGKPATGVECLTQRAFVHVVNQADGSRNAQDKEHPGEARLKTGATQDNAITLSDRIEPSSPLQPEAETAHDVPTEPEKSHRSIKQAAEIPQTPAAIKPSLPANHTDIDEDPRLLVDEAPRRSAIIAFDRTGPRNQGTRSAKKGVPDLAWTKHSSHSAARSTMAPEAFSVHAGSHAHRQNGPSSAAISMRTTKPYFTARPSNVANNVNDALAGFLSKAKSSVPMPVRARSRRTAPSPLAQEPPQNHAKAVHGDDGYLHVDNLNDTTMVEQEATQITEPLEPREGVDQEMEEAPPQASKADNVNSSHRAPTVPSMLDSVDANNAVIEHDQLQSRRAGAKRKPQGTAEDFTEAKKLKRAHAKESSQSKAVTRNDKQLSSLEHPIAVETVQSVATMATQKVARKVSRYASQSNVDIHGSPIPKDMEVPENTTALEYYSQQAAVSSDLALAQAVALPRTAAPEKRGYPDATTLDPMNLDEVLAMPPKLPEAMSSIKKRKPASPQRESRLVTAVALGTIDPENLTIPDLAAPPSTNPSTTSENATKQPSKGSSSSTLKQQLREAQSEIAALSGQRHAKQASVPEDDDPDRTLVEPGVERSRAKTWKNTRTDRAPPPPSSRGTDFQTLNDWYDNLPAHYMNVFDEGVSAFHRLTQTLVDEETARREKFSDYRRSLLNAVEAAEQKRAEDYQISLQMLEQERKRVMKGFEAHSESLKALVAQVGRDRELRKRNKGVDAVDDAKVQAMVAQYG
ncbi:hypothetical protein BAUCODRAFT_319786 [Baudoinia panamericana UAMH 10762]|uniref:Uncharacterized protein n=1 Tax=Baudoinia panamericana (strain UAMH 10762) TaxID=717646 RepID=M2MIZ7_BAUPA|nr:uncharacterized protein BAUCODRAFT_319786 [Baudoinia panamericana UAMH 10762]EMC91248.1 hypothetical protein BAUCODRAFT_319786 [Baudoinia panamericana UAMH 10762]